ncbi:DsbA family protein [Uliginosibacterium sp. sgz301328]|uniref:DsbA family protein n=1 Tax=Uliginosibacterium sp. sgz301328 TaxID=3243764 RepID=UPI00359D04B2
MPSTLHYIYDPLCGWCYGAAPLVRAVRDLPGVSVALHGGAMFLGANRQPVTEQLRNYVMQHDRRISALSGQPFGQDYFDILLRDHTAVLDSDPPIAAILAAQALTGGGLDMLARIQTAHYVEGRRVSDEAVLAALAEEIGLDVDAFERQFEAAVPQVAAHARESNALLRSVGGGGYPTFALERDGAMRVLSPGQYLGKPQAWRDAVAAAVA